MLPLVVAVGCTLAALGWRRGAVAWLGVTAVTLGVAMVMKLTFVACGPPALRTPSGHTAAAAMVLGGLAVVLSRKAGWKRVLLASAAGAAVIGLSRLLLHVHTAPEVLVGGAIGIAGALALAWLAGPAPSRLRLRWLVVVVLAVVAVLHGVRVDAEPRIDRAAFDGARLLGVCRQEPPLLGPAHVRILRHPFQM